MMPVVVDHGDARGLTLDFEPASHTLERLDASLYRVKRQIELQPDGRGGEGVAHHVLAGQSEADLTEELTASPNGP